MRLQHARGWTFVDQLLQDLRYATRGLRRSPGFTAIATLTLAAGISGITTIFSVVNGVILRPLPYGNADRLVIVSEVAGAASDWPDRAQVFDGLTSFEYAPFTLTDGSDAPVVIGGHVPPNFFSVLATEPQIGRAFNLEDAAGARPNTAIVSYAFWRGRLGGDPDVVGRTLKFAEATVTVIGVMSASFRAPVYWDAQVFTPVPRIQAPRRYFARLKPGISPAAAESTVNSLAVSRSVRVLPILPVDASNRTLLLLLFSSVGFLLLMAIVNVANLMLSRTVTRQREIAVRSALGASRPQLMRQLLTESVLLAMLGGAVGLLLGYAGTRLVVSWIPESFPRAHEIYMDLHVAGFVLVVTLLTALSFGIFPAFAFSRPAAEDSLKDASHRASESRGNRYLRQALIAVEIGLAAVLLIGAALTGRSFWNLINVPLGLDPHNVAVARVNVPPRFRTGVEQYRTLRRDIMERIKQHAEVDAVSMAGVGPVFSGRPGAGLWLEGRSQAEDATVLDTEVTSEYFQTLRITFIKGRTFKDDDQAAVINETFAKAFWPNLDPIGRRLRSGRQRPSDPWLTVVGVVRDQPPELASSPIPQVFRSCEQCGILFVKARNDSAGIGAIIRHEIASISDSSIMVTNLWSMETALSQSGAILNSRFRMALFAAFAGAGLLLAFAGVYGVTSYSATQRSQEIGIRIALGATRGNVLRMIIGQSVLPITLGIVAGVAAAFGLAGLLKSYLFEVAPTDANVFIAVPTFLMLVAIAANLIPARRSTRIDPTAALKYE